MVSWGLLSSSFPFSCCPLCYSRVCARSGTCGTDWRADANLVIGHVRLPPRRGWDGPDAGLGHGGRRGGRGGGGAAAGLGALEEDRLGDALALCARGELQVRLDLLGRLAVAVAEQERLAAPVLVPAAKGAGIHSGRCWCAAID